ncbi:MAG: hypothetical protein NPIRA02_39930 [Nitrospirales bacterium]|nr:MAG: hypothetical protein NPIRA02_39930 [Nitrospirales bacterium]
MDGDVVNRARHAGRYVAPKMAALIDNLLPDKDTTNIRREEANFLHRACRVWGVNEFVKPIRDHSSVKDTELQKDINNFNALVRTNAVLLWHLHRCTQDAHYASSFLAVTSRDRIQSQIRNFSNINRLSFATMGNFFLENMLRDLVADLGGKPKKNFHDLSEQAVCLAHLANPEEHSDGLRVTSKLRNTFHNRGIHKGMDESITVKGITYDFKHNDIVKGHASWDYLCHGFACALSTVLELVEKARPSHAT